RAVRGLPIGPRMRPSEPGPSRRYASSRSPTALRTRLSWPAVNVLLPDGSKLELPDGATGLDAARAIRPRLAEQAVLVRSNGNLKDPRQPQSHGEELQLLTTRDKDDPDALYV